MWNLKKMSDRWTSWKPCVCLLVLIGLAGCNKTPTATNPAETGETVTDEGGTKTTNKRIIPIRRDVKTFDGTWVMVLTQQGRDHYIWISAFEKDDAGKFQTKLIDVGQMSAYEPKLELSEVGDKSVHLQVRNKVALLDFVGEFDGIAIRGTLSPSPMEVYPARLLPVDATKLSDYVPDALPPGADIYMNAVKKMQNQPQPEIILQIARENRTSPLTLDTLFGLITLAPRAGFDDKILLESIDLYIDTAKIWGTRMQAQAELLVSQQLVTSGKLPAEAMKHLDAAEKLVPESDQVVRSRIQLFREQAEIQVALQTIRSKSDESHAAAYKELQAGLEKQPFNAEILEALGVYAAAHDQREAAITYYTKIVTLPMLEPMVLARRMGQPAGDPTPKEVLTKLWTEQHGNEDGLDASLAKVYDETLNELRTQMRKKTPEVPATDDSNHTVLVEFFTGAQMPPTVATEVAMDAIRETYPTSKVVALRFHQHIPGADGLVSQDSEDRFASYEQGKIPLVALDGAILNPDQVPYSGYLQASGVAYSIFRSVIDPRLKQTTPVQIHLVAKVENDEFTIEGSATGMAEEDLPTLRLRLALAEQQVEAVMPNGIRHHAMVVREMPGGARGVTAKKGELKFSLSMPVSELQQRLDEYQQRFETGKKIEIPAHVKPAIRGPLYLVGWVQNDKVDQSRPDIGRAVLQTAIIPVEGFGPANAEPTVPVESPAKDATEAPNTPAPPALPEQ